MDSDRELRDGRFARGDCSLLVCESLMLRTGLISCDS